MNIPQPASVRWPFHEKRQFSGASPADLLSNESISPVRTTFYDGVNDRSIKSINLNCP